MVLYRSIWDVYVTDWSNQYLATCWIYGGDLPKSYIPPVMFVGLTWIRCTRNYIYIYMRLYVYIYIFPIPINQAMTNLGHLGGRFVVETGSRDSQSIFFVPSQVSSQRALRASAAAGETKASDFVVPPRKTSTTVR